MTRSMPIEIEKVDDQRFRIPRQGRMNVPGLVFADEALMQGIRQDQALQQELNELAMYLEDLYPMRDLRKRYPFRGDEPMSLQEAMKLMGDLQELDHVHLLPADNCAGGFITAGELCVGNVDGTNGPCAGDSGKSCWVSRAAWTARWWRTSR